MKLNITNQEIKNFTIEAASFKNLRALDLKNNKEGLTKLIVVLLKDYTNGTFERTDYSSVNKIIKKYEGVESNDTSLIIQKQYNQITTESEIYKYALSFSFLTILLIKIESLI
mgnify:CR=1 FL=1